MRRPISRRTLLRGAGTALALPFLEAMLPARGRAPAPSRLVYLYVPNGVFPVDWRPREEGPELALSWSLEPLADLRARVSVLRGLTQDKARANGDGPGDHARAAAVFLTGVQPLKADGAVRAGISADQLAAQMIGASTRFRSVQLGLERARNSGECDSGYSCAYSGNISWQSETTPAAKEVDPRLCFDRLFRGGADAPSGPADAARRARRKSVLDYVREDAEALRRELGAEDQRKLDEYFSGLRELERRIARAEQARVDAVPDDARPDGVPGDYAEHARVMLELLALALATDCTRVATFMFSNEGSNRAYPELGVAEGHHSLSHHGEDPAKTEQVRRIDRFHVELLAGFLHRLAELRDGEADLLDATTVVYGSGIADGNRHDHHDLPILLAGGGGRRIPLGHHLRFPDETPLGDLHLALLEELGVPAARLGDATGPLVVG